MVYYDTVGYFPESMDDAVAFVQKTYWPDMKEEDLTYIIHSGFISGYQNRYGDNLKPPTNVYHRMTA